MKRKIIFLLAMFSYAAHSQITPVSAETCEHMKSSNTITDNNPVDCGRLNSVTFNFIDFTGEKRTGEVVVLDIFSPQVEAIFKELYTKGFPLKKATPLENYNGDDNESMKDNNTSAFNGRVITNTTGWSKHAYGAAIDINPLNNPYLSFSESGVINVSPAESYINYINRLNYRPGKDYRPGLAEEARNIFFSHGFLRWGGYWDNPIDYQHFEVGSLDYIDTLLEKPLDKAREDFFTYGETYKECMNNSIEKDPESRMKACVEESLK